MISLYISFIQDLQMVIITFMTFIDVMSLLRQPKKKFIITQQLKVRHSIRLRSRRWRYMDDDNIYEKFFCQEMVEMCYFFTIYCGFGTSWNNLSFGACFAPIFRLCRDTKNIFCLNFSVVKMQCENSFYHGIQWMEKRGVRRDFLFSHTFSVWLISLSNRERWKPKSITW